MRLRLLLTAFLTLAIVASASADDVGLASARLIEQAGDSYTIEVDVSPALIGAVAPPILPVGFEADGKPEYRRLGAIVNVRYEFHGQRPLSAGDVILLPWARTGVMLEARWLDGSRGSRLFLTRVEGVPVAIDMLRPKEASTREVLLEHLGRGAKHVVTGWAIWFLIIAVALLVPSVRAVSIVFAIIVGYAVALVASDLVSPEVPTLLAKGLFLIAAILAARCVLRVETASDKTPWVDGFTPALIGAGVVDGLAYSAGTSGSVALTAFVLGASAVLLVAAGTVAAVVAVASRQRIARLGLAMTVGGAAVAGLLGVVVAEPSPEAASRDMTADRFQLTRGSTVTASSAAGGARAPSRLTHPFTIFLTIEPHEVRCEILAAGTSLTGLLDSSLEQADVIGVHEQPQLIEEALARLQEDIVVIIDGQGSSPNISRAEFLTLSAGGAATRPTPVPETIDSAILGVTLAYATTVLPDRVMLEWAGQPAEVVPVTLTDPNGVDGAELSAQSHSVVWENDLVGFVPPAVVAVAVSRPTWAAASCVLMVIGLAVWAVGVRRSTTVLYLFTALAIGLFPAVRPATTWGDPIPADQTASVVERLMTNVYRSFSHREEGMTYDDLAVSVTGDQLTEVYFEQRRALDLENRGGARARVDRVEVTRVDDVTGDANGSVTITARWNVSGSVNHFGHTHYRRNSYVARVSILPVEGAWKITGIEVLEEDREL